MENDSIPNTPRELRQTVLQEFSQEDPVDPPSTPRQEVPFVPPSTPRQKRKSKNDDDSDPKKFCEAGQGKNILSQMIALTSLFTEFKNDVSKRLTSIEEDVQLIKQNTLLQAEPIDNVEKLDLLTQAVNEIREKVRLGTSSSLRDGGSVSQSVRLNLPTLDSKGEYKRKLDLNKRKQAYYNKISAEDRCEILLAQSSEDPPSVPAKYLPTFIENEHPEDLVVRQEFSKAKIDCDVKSLQNKSLRYKIEVDQIDAKVSEEILEDISLSDAEKEWQLDEWKKKVQEEEKKSADFWRKKHNEIVATPENQKASGKIISVNGNLLASSSKRKKPTNPEGSQVNSTSTNNDSTPQVNNTDSETNPSNEQPFLEVRNHRQRRRNRNQRGGTSFHNGYQRGRNVQNRNQEGGNHNRNVRTPNQNNYQSTRTFNQYNQQRNGTWQQGQSRRNFYNSNRNW